MKLLPGQPIYNETDNYLTIGSISGDKTINQLPIATRELHGYFNDNDGIAEPQSSDDIKEFWVKSKSSALAGNQLEIFSSDKISINSEKEISINAPTVKITGISDDSSENQSLAEILNKVNEHEASIDAFTQFKTDAETNFTDIKSISNANAASITALTGRVTNNETSLAGFKNYVDDEIAEAVQTASKTFNNDLNIAKESLSETINEVYKDGKAISGQIVSQIGDFVFLQDIVWSPDSKNTSKIYKALKNQDSQQYYYYYYINGNWLETDDPLQAGCKVTSAGIITSINSAGDSQMKINADKITFTIEDYEAIADNIEIKADKIKLEGYVKFEDLKANGTTEIDGSNIITGTITTETLDANSIKSANRNGSGTDFTYTPGDLFSVEGSKFDLNTGDIITPTFSVIDGKTNVDGNISATSGSIGGWTIDGDKLGYKQNETDTSYYSWIAPNGYEKYAMKIGDSFKVTKSGVITADNITVNGGEIAGWKMTTGVYTLQNGVIGKYLKSKDENVGMWSASDSTTETINFWAGGPVSQTDSITNNPPPFFVTNKGNLYADNACINGTIEATSGKLTTNIYIQDKQLTVTDSTTKDKPVTQLTQHGINIYNDNGAREFRIGPKGIGSAHNLALLQFKENTPETTPNTIVAQLSVTKGTGDYDRLTLTLDQSSNILRTFNICVQYVGIELNKVITVPAKSTEAQVDIPKRQLLFKYRSFYFKESGSAYYAFLDVTDTDNLKGEIIVRGSLVPLLYNSDGGQFLGTSGSYWSGAYIEQIYYKDGSIGTSDRNKKNSIQNLDEKYSLLFDELRPVTFKFNDGTSDRTHTGLIAQEVKEAVEKVGLTTQEVAAYCEWEEGEGDDKHTTCGLRYSELIALCVDEIQKLKQEVKELQSKIK